MANNDRNELYRFVQNDTNFMLLTESEFKGNTYYDIRKYFTNDKGQEIATKKGLMLSKEEWLKVIDILQEFLLETNEKDDWDASMQDNKTPNTSDFDFSCLDNVTVGNTNPFGDDDSIPFF